MLENTHIAIAATSTFLDNFSVDKDIFLKLQCIILDASTHVSINNAVITGHELSVSLPNIKYITPHHKAAMEAKNTHFHETPDFTEVTFNHSIIAHQIINIIASHCNQIIFSHKNIIDKSIVNTVEVLAIGHKIQISPYWRLL